MTKSNPWIQHVQRFKVAHGCSYSEALVRARPSYRPAAAHSKASKPLFRSAAVPPGARKGNGRGVVSSHEPFETPKQRSERIAHQRSHQQRHARLPVTYGASASIFERVRLKFLELLDPDMYKHERILTLLTLRSQELNEDTKRLQRQFIGRTGLNLDVVPKIFEGYEDSAEKDLSAQKEYQRDWLEDHRPHGFTLKNAFPRLHEILNDKERIKYISLWSVSSIAASIVYIIGCMVRIMYHSKKTTDDAEFGGIVRSIAESVFLLVKKLGIHLLVDVGTLLLPLAVMLLFTVIAGAYAAATVGFEEFQKLLLKYTPRPLQQTAHRLLGLIRLMTDRFMKEARRMRQMD